MQSNNKGWKFTHILIDYLRDGTTGLREIPQMIVEIVDGDLWREFYCEPIFSQVTHKTFADYVADPIPSGLGADIKTLKNICRDDAAALDAIDRACKQEHGGNRNPHGRSGKPETGIKTDIVKVDSCPAGNSRDAALRRLRKDRPDLHTMVLSNELSAHAAMVEAGFRKKPTPDEVAIKAARKAENKMAVAKAVFDSMDDTQRGQLLLLWNEWLTQGGGK